MKITITFLHTIHNLSAFLIFISALIKIFLHYYLDNKHGRTYGLSSFIVSPLNYFLLYKADVTSNDELKKYICNAMLYLFYFSFLINAVAGLMIFSKTFE